MKLRDLNPFWRQLPVYSPVTFRSLWAGLVGAIGYGDPLERLQDLLLSEYGSCRLLLADSGTSALRLAISGALADTGSDIVALPAYCCFDVATAAVGADAKVALYDVRPDTLGPDFDSLREALDAGAQAIVVAGELPKNPGFQPTAGFRASRLTRRSGRSWAASGPSRRRLGCWWRCRSKAKALMRSPGLRRRCGSTSYRSTRAERT